MASLTTSDKELIESNGGILLEDGRAVRFVKTNKPNKMCKKRLTELGYKITKESGASYNRFMVYVLCEQD